MVLRGPRPWLIVSTNLVPLGNTSETLPSVIQANATPWDLGRDYQHHASVLIFVDKTRYATFFVSVPVLELVVSWCFSAFLATSALGSNCVVFAI
ncbi:hypothetical protein F5Y04DRAFT_242441 [Hypomontagnella monticulosa]|nr:hypothetical protein F5Y04DRAFT_242441 [Hypomontagnella monticulosa]